MSSPTADVLLLYKKLSELRDAGKLLITQLLSPLKHDSLSIYTLVTRTILLLLLLL